MRKYMNKSILALASGTFGLGMSECLMMGILPDIARDINVSIPSAGHFISAYAVGVALGAPLFAVICNTYPLKKILLFLISVFTIGNLAVALSTDYFFMIFARFISGLPHGSFFGVGAIVAKKLALKNHESQAISYIISGITIANLIGVPLGTYISHVASWRMIIFGIGIFGILVFFAILKEIPYIEALKNSNLKEQFKFLSKPAPWILFIAIILGNGGIFCWYSYINPILTEVSGFSPSHMTQLMMIAGLGMVLGNYISGIFSDKYSPINVAIFIQYVSCFVLISIFWGAQYAYISLFFTFLCTMCLFGLSTPEQILLINNAKNGEMFGAAAAQVAFNLGNAIGAYMGSEVLILGYNYEYTAALGAFLSLAGFLLLFVLKNAMFKGYSHIKMKKPSNVSN